jgi:hypothetical protein
MPSARLMVLITTPRLLDMKKEKKKLGAQSVGTTKGVKTDDDFELLN